MNLSPAVTGAIAGAIAGGATTAALRAISRGYRKLVGWFTARLRPDHRSLHTAEWQLHAPPQANGPNVRVLVACAPSKSLRRASFKPAIGIEFVRRHYGGQFPFEPAFVNVASGLRFEDPANDFTHAWIWPNGRMDLSVNIPTLRNDQGGLILDVIDVLCPIASLAGAAADPQYRSIFGVRRTLLSRRFDWFAAVSTDVQEMNTARREWAGLTFPGRTPQRAAAGQRPFCPVGGYAAKELRGWSAGRPTSALLRVFLTSFLHENGYFNADGAVDDAIQAWLETSLSHRSGET